MRGYNIDDYIGNRYNHLTLIKNVNKINENNSKLALFECDCGNVKELVFTQVLNGKIKTCGCKQGFSSMQEQKEKHKIALLKYNMSDTIKSNTSGFRGITIVNGKYRARIQINKKSKHLGYFNTLDEAIQTRKEAEEKYFKPVLDKYNQE